MSDTVRTEDDGAPPRRQPVDSASELPRFSYEPPGSSRLGQQSASHRSSPAFDRAEPAATPKARRRSRAARARESVDPNAVPTRRITLEADLALTDDLPGRNHNERTRVLQRLLLAWTRIGSDPLHGCDLQSLSGLTQYSIAHLQRSFTRVFGMSPHRAAVIARMRIAHDLLRGTALSIGDVAARAGYVDRAAFARAYRRFHHESPSATRAQLRAGAEPARPQAPPVSATPVAAASGAARSVAAEPEA